MSNNKIYEVINKLGKSTISIVEFKPFYTPVELSTQLKSLEATGFAQVDWSKKEIKVFNFQESKLIADRNSVNRKRIIPESLKVDKIEINKPILNYKRED